MTRSRDDDLALAALGRTLASIAGSDFNLPDLLQGVVEEAARLCDADSANIAVRDGAVYAIQSCRSAEPP